MHQTGEIATTAVILLWTILLINSGTIAAQEYELIADSRGAPRLVVNGDRLPSNGAFWMRINGNAIGNQQQQQRGNNQLSVASIDVNGVVKVCSIDLNGTRRTAIDWHLFKWILRPTEFTCILIADGDHQRTTNLTTTVPLVTNRTSPTNRLAYTISPGAGNADFCLVNVTVGNGNDRAVDCVRVKKTATASTPSIGAGVNQSCDCPDQPPSILASEANSRIFEQQAADEDSPTDLRNNRVTAANGDGNHDDGRWLNSSLWAIDFPTPSPFDPRAATTNSRLGIGAAAVVKSGTTSRSGTTTKSVARINLSNGGRGGNGSTSLVITTTTSPQTFSPRGTTAMTMRNSSSSWCDISTNGNNTCRNGGVCLASSTNPERFYCNCSLTSGFRGDFCELAGESINSTTTIRQQSTTTNRPPEPIKCPEDYCQNGGTCRANIINDTVRGMANFTCYCPEEYLGDRCALANPCYSTNQPCENGGTCSIRIPINSSSTIDGSPFQCRCREGFDGERCELSTTVQTSTTTTTTSEVFGPVDGAFPTTSSAPSNRTTITINSMADCSDVEKSSCKNGGVCSRLDQRIVCKCPANFSGDYCETHSTTGVSAPSNNDQGTSSQQQSKPNIGAIVGGVFGALAFVGLIIGSIFAYRCIQRSRKLKGKYNPAKEEATASGGQTMSMTTVTTGERLI